MRSLNMNAGSCFGVTTPRVRRGISGARQPSLTVSSAAETFERNAIRDRDIRGYLRPALQYGYSEKADTLGQQGLNRRT